MKKLVSLILSIMLIIAIPIYAAAEETDTITRDELIELACSVFPEYASNIRSEHQLATQNNSRSFAQTELVNEVTRSISDTHTLTYSEYSNGAVYLTSAEIDPWYIPDYNYSDNSTTMIYIGHIIVTCNFNEDAIVIINNIKFALVDRMYDFIISGGSCTGVEYARVTGPHTTRLNEAANRPAEIYYDLHITGSDGNIEPFTLYFRVANDSYSVDHVYQ